MALVRVVSAVVIAIALGGCAIQRAQIASEAQNKMVDLTKEQALACIGPPSAKAAEGTTEVWSCHFGNDHTQMSTFG